MIRFIGAALVAVLALGFGGGARAEGDKDTTAIIDKAIKAAGGEERLSKIKAATWKSNGKITFGGTDSNFTTESTAEGLDKYRGEFEGDFGGNKFKGVTVLNGDKGWQKFGDMERTLTDEQLANEKRMVYLHVVPATLVALKGKDFKVVVGKEEKVDGKPATVIAVTPPDGKDFTLYFDKETGLPVKVVAKVTGFMGDEFTQETSLGKYKDFDGIKKATKIEDKRDNERFRSQEITEFKVLDTVDPKTFDEPK